MDMPYPMGAHPGKRRALREYMVNKFVDEKQGTAGLSVKNTGSAVALGVIYLLCALRYYPGRPMDTLVATAEHLLASVPFSLGFTIVVVSVLAKVSRQKPRRFFVVRLFLTFGIIAEFFFGLYNYLSSNQ